MNQSKFTITLTPIERTDETEPQKYEVLHEAENMEHFSVSHVINLLLMTIEKLTDFREDELKKRKNSQQ